MRTHRKDFTRKELLLTCQTEHQAQYDPEVQALYLRLLSAPVMRSRLLDGGDVVLDLDELGRVVGVEVLELDADLAVLTGALAPACAADVARAVQAYRPGY